ncbi:MAG: serine/threonine-protein kinase, partial [Verrucomicrobiota bacterium]
MKPSADPLIELFHEARARNPGPERDGFLIERCRDQDGLREQVVSLLEADQDAGGFLAPPLPPAAGGATERVSERIGAYRLLQPLGEGGCGVVYLAEQEDPVRRQVALKVIKLGMDTKQVVARFEAERQALALMDHPHIAKVFDAGATRSGRPYFVMELVRGTRITDYCTQRRLATRDRLELFVEVCQAVQHAHQKGVIHRDLKPSNILVTARDGTAAPKIIDFGIAKATTDQQLTDKTLFTAVEHFMGTPAYMSPEQAQFSGLDVDTRTDIYSLGVLLYELLTGRTPFDQNELLGAGLDEMRRTIREKEPARPSARLTQELTRRRGGSESGSPDGITPTTELIRLIRGDLDWIVMKCLEKDRTRRYETANGLALDIQRHLQNEPVVARPPSNLYRFERLVRRNRLAFAAISVVAAVVGVGLAGVLWQWRRAEQHARGESRHRRAAEESAARTRLHRYAADIGVAAQAVERGDYGLARRTLAALAPLEGEEDLRGFEWRYLWGRCQGDQLATLQGHEWIVTCAAFSPDGNLLATGSQDATTRVWDRARRQAVTVLRGTNEAIWSVAFSPDGTLLMTAGSQGSVTFRRTTNWQVMLQLPGHMATLSRTGSLAAVSSASPFWWEPAGRISLWDYRAGNELKTFGRPGRSIALSADGKLLAVAGETTGLDLWDTASGQLLRSITTQKPIWSINFSPEGNHLATTGWSSEVWIYPVTGLSPAQTVSGHKLTVWSATYSPDGLILATTGADQTIRLWDAHTLQWKSTLRGQGGEVWCAAFSPDAEWLVSGGKDQNVMLWSAKPRSMPPLVPNEKDWRPVFSPDGDQMIVAASLLPARRFALWDVPRRAQIGEIPGTLPCGFSEDGKRVALLSLNQDALEFWTPGDETVDRIPLANVHAARRPFHLFGLSPERGVFFGIDQNGLISLWQAATGAFLASFHGPAPPVRNVILGPAGQLIALSVERDSLVRLYERASSRERALTGHRDFISGLAFSPDGALLASGSVDGTIRLWDTATGQSCATLFGHMQEATDVAFSNDGRTLASVGFGEAARLWHLATSRE